MTVEIVNRHPQRVLDGLLSVIGFHISCSQLDNSVDDDNVVVVF